MKEFVFSSMLSRDQLKYKSFIRNLRRFSTAYAVQSANPVESRLRGEFLETYYALMRYMDDIADRDMHPADCSPADYIRQKISFMKSGQEPEDICDKIIMQCRELASGFGEDFEQETEEILGSLLFDAERYGTMSAFPEKELLGNFYSMDTGGTIKAALKVFGEDPSKYHELKDLGRSARIHYTLRDLPDDLDKGFLNITKEDISGHGICADDLEKAVSESRMFIRCNTILNKEKDSPAGLSKFLLAATRNSRKEKLREAYLKSLPEAITNWYIKQTAEGFSCLGRHRQNMKNRDYKPLTRLALYACFEAPARKFYAHTLCFNLQP